MSTHLPPSPLVLCCDVDGVLNTRPDSLDEDKLHRLRAILENTRARLVISSTWRKTERQRQRLLALRQSHGIAIRDWTPNTDRLDPVSRLWVSDSRAQEISAWLTHNVPSGTPYLVLDDDRTLIDSPHRPHLILTDADQGLTAQQTFAICKRFTAPTR